MELNKHDLAIINEIIKKGNTAIIKPTHNSVKILSQEEQLVKKKTFTEEKNN